MTALQGVIAPILTPFEDAGLIAGQKAVLAVRSGDRRWLNLRAPHLNATREQGEALLETLGRAADHIGAGSDRS